MKLVILDRDGVINHDSDQFIKSPEEWNPIPGSLEAIARLNQAGYRVVVATNQSGLGRGLFCMDMLNRIHAKMHKKLAAVGGRIDAVFLCPHPADAGCDSIESDPGPGGGREHRRPGDASVVLAGRRPPLLQPVGQQLERAAGAEGLPAPR